jgi:hypothetical protein
MLLFGRNDFKYLEAPIFTRSENCATKTGRTKSKEETEASPRSGS